MYTQPQNYQALEVRYQKIVRYKQRLAEQLNLPRIPVSAASQLLVQFISETNDPMVPSVWGSREDDPFTAGQNSCCPWF
ncbi:Guanine nucleotide-binding protein subunit gamma [Dispira simplex]|nr:Guanine nucleotide-binding protein subunit gamma [Dispira simplex]